MSWTSSKLLIDEPPLQVLPSLACAVGLNEAIFIQQIHYWLRTRRAVEEGGKMWIRMSYEDWHEQFPFWSFATVKRIILSAEKRGLAISRHCGRPGDRTKLYSVDHDAVDALSEDPGEDPENESATLTLTLNQRSKSDDERLNLTRRTSQSDPTNVSICTVPYIEGDCKETNTDTASSSVRAREGSDEGSTLNPEPASTAPDEDCVAGAEMLSGIEDLRTLAVGLPNFLEGLSGEFPEASVLGVCREYQIQHMQNPGQTKHHPRRLRAFFRVAHERAVTEREDARKGAEAARRNREVEEQVERHERMHREEHIPIASRSFGDSRPFGVLSDDELRRRGVISW